MTGRILTGSVNSPSTVYRQVKARDVSVETSLTVGSSPATIKAIRAGTFSPAGSGSVAANGSAVVTVTIAGLAVGDMVMAVPEGAMSGPVHYAGCWVSAANTLSILYQNSDFATARSSSTPPTFRYVWFDLT